MDDLAAAFKALGHPHRLAIVRRLIDEAKSCCAPYPEDCTADPRCCDFAALAAELDVAKGTVSHHLKELDRAGLIVRERSGRRLYCRVNPERLDELRRFLRVSAPEVES